MEDQNIKRNTLGQFETGTVANPEGRTMGSLSLVNMLKKKLLEAPAGQERTYAEALILRVLKLAIEDSDSAMIRDIIDRIDGKPNQKMEHSGDIKVIITDYGTDDIPTAETTPSTKDSGK